MSAVVDRVVGLLGGVKQNGTGWTAQCPAHDDKTPSLSISDGDDRALLNCHAGCPTEAIIGAIGLTMADLFDEPMTATRTRDDTVRYHYTDENGSRLYDAVRRSGKKFHLAPANGKRGAGAMNGTQLVLYRLPEVIRAVKKGGTVYVVEGEKDADRLVAEGLVATCNPMGAGKWSKVADDACKVLAGANVVVIRDRDDPGRRHAAEIVSSIEATVASVALVEAVEGKDVSDHLNARRIIDELVPVDGDDGSDAPDVEARRHVFLTPASTIQPRPVKWLWNNRVALGTLALLGGREGIGKSMFAYQLAADITCGQLPGHHHGTPKAVLICATEDSWAHTIVPRLMAAGADLDRVYRVDVTTSEGVAGTLTLPADNTDLELAVTQVEAAAIILDPLLSRLSTTLDTHKDAEVRVGLEPLVALADRTGAAVIGLIHVNKATTVDPLTMLMASRAFAAVARAVLFVAVDPHDESTGLRYVGQPKNNLGSTDQPLLSFTIESVKVADTDEGPVRTGRVAWQGEDDRSIADVLRSATERQTDRTDHDAAEGWLRDYLTVNPIARSDEVRAAAKTFGHKEHTLKRARQEIGAGLTNNGFPRRVFWSRPGMTPDEVDAALDAQSEQIPGETHQSVLTVPTEGLNTRSETVGTVGTSPRFPTRNVSTVTPPPRSCQTCGSGVLDDRGDCSESACAGF